MPLVLKNSYSKALEVFAPLDPAGRRVTLYTCGPTVYSHAHIGNFRSFLLADLLRRVLIRRGFVVRQVMNITDVGHMTEDHLADASGEDKLAKAARELGQDPALVARHFERAFVEDAKRLRLSIYQGQEADAADLHPRATEHIPEMLAMIQQLLDRGYAYCDLAGQVYFRVARFAEYGRLSGKDISELESGARVAVRDEKEDPRDFALWKVDDKHLMKWDPRSGAGFPPAEWERYRALVPGGVDPRIGAGFPGWHIECSAMARARLGDTIDIHTGGEDNIFPHHECEIAQSFGAFGSAVPAPQDAADAGQSRPCFARYWLHGRHLLVDGRKMSKRDGTFYTLGDLLDPEKAGRPDLGEALQRAGFLAGRVPANVLRYALIAAPYTQPMNFTLDALCQAKTCVERLQSRLDRLREKLAERAGDRDAGGHHGGDGDNSPAAELHALLQAAEAGFDAALDNNLNMSQALAEVFAAVAACNQRDAELTTADARAALALLEGFDAILDVLDRQVRSGLVPTASLDSFASAGSGGPGPSTGELPEPPDEAQIERALCQRHADKRAKRFQEADAIRMALRDRGIVIEDTPHGVRWKRR
jgi:cysteinyl-tRNA synthetase